MAAHCVRQVENIIKNHITSEELSIGELELDLCFIFFPISSPVRRCAVGGTIDSVWLGVTHFPFYRFDCKEIRASVETQKCCGGFSSSNVLFNLN